MDKLSFKAFNELCQLNLDKKYIQELFEIITNSDCYFQPGIVMPQDHIASLYKLRLNIAKDHGKFDDDYINDYEITVSNLQESKSNELGITWLDTDNNGSYLIFYEPDQLNILGVLKAKRTSDEQSTEKDNNDAVNKGHSSGCQKYLKRKIGEHPMMQDVRMFLLEQTN
ncbi:hypothetical protein FAM09_18415 [Niastella caeni]|uniref:Uncharacterized protein n=1 Tax=Niastella caeni TaxID=2569763 RepID=A0A4S8HNI1_9BACT|nr:hypothetical protein [Niastella caeni]THU36938.1 hypothetical protein FAM09_18415 [Niastella caeni]